MKSRYRDCISCNLQEKATCSNFQTFKTIEDQIKIKFNVLNPSLIFSAFFQMLLNHRKSFTYISLLINNNCLIPISMTNPLYMTLRLTKSATFSNSLFKINLTAITKQVTGEDITKQVNIFNSQLYIFCGPFKILLNFFKF